MGVKSSRFRCLEAQRVGLRHDMVPTVSGVDVVAITLVEES